MKSLIILFLFTITSQSQIPNREMIKRDILSDILRNENFNTGELFITSKIDSINVEYLLKSISKKPFIVNFNNRSKNLMLTAEELEYLSKRIREQYQHEWREEDFNNRNIINQSDIFKYLDKDVKNQVIMISDPIFIKNDDTAFIYIANACCCSSHINSSMALYTKTDGLWKKSFEIIEDSY